MWVYGFVLCVVVVGKVWLLFEGIWVCGRGGSITYGVTLVGVVLRGCVGFHPRLCKLCGSCGCVVVCVGGGGCTGSDCGMMSGQKSLRGRMLRLVYRLAR